MATADRVLSVLMLFTIERPEWTVDAIGGELGFSASTAYQYVGSLVKVGLLVQGKAGFYTVGPAAIELDRTARQVDPLTRDVAAILRDLVADSGPGTLGLLCRIYRLHVTCVDQHAVDPPAIASSYERGRPMPLFRGSASKVILAHLPSRLLQRFYGANAEALSAVGLGHDLRSFREEMRRLRRQDSLVSVGELDPGAMGISAPVFGEDGAVLGSIGLVAEAALIQSNTARLNQLRAAVEEAGRTATQALRSAGVATPSSARRAADRSPSPRP